MKNQTMTHDVTAGRLTALAFTVLGTALSWLPYIEAVLRIIATIVAIIAGIVTIWPQLRKFCRRKNHKK